MARKKGHVRCLNEALQGSRFCYRHTLFRWKGIPIAKNATVHMVAVVLGFFLLSFLLVGHWSEDWLAMMSEMNQGIAAVEKLRGHLKREQDMKPAVLSQSYPLGYVLFAIDSMGNLAYDDSPHREFGVDWDQARVVQITNRAVSLAPPSVFFKEDACVMSGTVVAFSREKATPSFFCDLDGKQVCLRIQRDTGDTIVFVLGLVAS